jgi:hypothetical protein
MKKIIIIMCALFFISAMAFAEETATKKPTTPAKIEYKYLTGKIDTVTLENKEQGIKPQLVVVDKNGNKTTFFVTTTTKIFGKDKKALTLDKLIKDENVRVKYIIKEGVNEAVTINVI